MNIKLLKKSIIILIIAIILILIVLLVVINKEKQPTSIFKQADETHYDEVKYNKYNEVQYAYINDQQLCNIYLTDYKNKMLKNKEEEAYKVLDEEYKEKRFGNFENFKNYITKNEEKIYGIKLAKYEVSQNKNGNRYICIDQYGNYYIFNETAIMQYSIILDTYTIDLPEYVEKYNASNPSEKVAFCVDKFIKNINAENYKLAYSMISEGFKNNYFKTLSSFEEYAKQNFLGKEITYNEIQNEADIYIYKVDLSGEERNFNVKLGEGTNFELSFNVN